MMRKYFRKLKNPRYISTAVLSLLLVAAVVFTSAMTFGTDNVLVGNGGTAAKVINMKNISTVKASAKWDGTTIAKDFSEGKGTSDEPYMIKDGSELAHLAEIVNKENSTYSQKYYTLKTDIDLGNHPFTPIGSNYNGKNQYFKGVFDGNGHTISNVNIKATDKQREWGLFGFIGTGTNNAYNTVKNLEINGMTVEITGNINSDRVVGTVVGGVHENGKVLNCIVKNTKIIANGATLASDNLLAVGGIAGSVERSVDSTTSKTNLNYSVENCYSECNIDLSGLNVNSSKTGTENSQFYVAGIIGEIRTSDGVSYNEVIIPKNCLYSGSINAEKAFVGPVYAAFKNGNYAAKDLKYNTRSAYWNTWAGTYYYKGTECLAVRSDTLFFRNGKDNKGYYVNGSASKDYSKADNNSWVKYTNDTYGLTTYALAKHDSWNGADDYKGIQGVNAGVGIDDISEKLTMFNDYAKDGYINWAYDSKNDSLRFHDERVKVLTKYAKNNNGKEELYIYADFGEDLDISKLEIIASVNGGKSDTYSAENSVIVLDPSIEDISYTYAVKTTDGLYLANESGVIKGLDCKINIETQDNVEDENITFKAKIEDNTDGIIDIEHYSEFVWYAVAEDGTKTEVGTGESITVSKNEYPVNTKFVCESKHNENTAKAAYKNGKLVADGSAESGNASLDLAGETFVVKTIFVNYAQSTDSNGKTHAVGNDSNDGSTPDKAVKTIQQAYKLLDDNGTVDSNYVIIMGYYSDNNFALSKSKVGALIKPAKITGAYGGVKYNGQENGKLRFDASNSNIGRCQHAATVYDDIVFDFNGSPCYYYAQHKDLTIGRNVVFRQLPYTKASESDGVSAGIYYPAFHLTGGYSKYLQLSDSEIANTNYSYDFSGDCTITLQSGVYGRVMSVSRANKPGSGYSASANYFRRAIGTEENPFKINVVLDFTDDNQQELKEANKANDKVGNDVALYVGGAADGSCFAETSLTVKGGKYDTIIGGSIGYDTLAKDPNNRTKSIYSNDFFGDSTITVEDGNISRIFGGSLGRVGDGNKVSTAATGSEQKYVNTRHFGTARTTLINGTVGSVFTTGAGGINYYKNKLSEMPDTDFNPVSGAWTKWEGNEQPDGEYASELVMKGGTINHDIYGSGYGYSDYMYGPQLHTLAGSIYGNTRIDISAGNVKGNVYGGGSGYEGTVRGYDKVTETAQLFGNSEVNISGGVISGNVYGGGFNARKTADMAKVNGNTKVNITGGNIAGNVYGGGANGVVTGNTNVTINDPDFQTHELIKGSVYGGSANSSVLGYAKTTIEKGCISGSVYGGGEKGVVNGYDENNNSTIVTVNDGKVVESVYGAGEEAEITAASYVNVTGGWIGDSVYGGGYKGSVNNLDGKGNKYASEVHLNYDGNEVLYVGDPDNLDSNGKLKIDSTKGFVFGGGFGADASIHGNTLVDVSYGNVFNSVFGGGELGKVLGNTEVNVTKKAKVENSVYGGGRGYGYGNDGKLETAVNGGQVTGDTNVTANLDYTPEYPNEFGDSETPYINNYVGGGGEGMTDEGDIAKVEGAGSVAGSTQVNVGYTSLGVKSVIGGGYGATANVGGNTNVVAKDSLINGDKVGDDLICIVGGGFEGAVSGNTSVNADGVFAYNKIIDKDDSFHFNGKVYGGGVQGKVAGDTNVTVKATNDEYLEYQKYDSKLDHIRGIEEVFGGGYKGEVQGNTSVNVLSGLYKNVFAGGSYGNVGGNADITVGDGTNKNAPFIQSAVYGGSAYAKISGNAKADVKSGYVGYDNQTQVADNKHSVAVTLNVPDLDPTANGEKNFIGGNVYGAGLGASSVVLGNVDVNVNNTGYTKVYNDIFGGGQAGFVGESGGSDSTVNVNVNKNGTEILMLNGSIYGGGQGYLINPDGTKTDSDSDHDALGGITGDIDLNVADVYCHAVVGGGELGNVDGSIDTDIKDSTLEGKPVYYTSDSVNTDRNEFKQYLIDYAGAAGGGYLGYVTGDVKMSISGTYIGNDSAYRKDNIKDITPAKHTKYKVDDDYNLINTDGEYQKINEISGCIIGAGVDANVKGNVTTEIFDTYVTGNVYGGGYMQEGTVGNSENNSTVNTKFDASRCQVIYGGGYSAKIFGSTSLVMGETGSKINTVMKSAYGGGAYSEITGDVAISVDNTYVGYDTENGQNTDDPVISDIVITGKNADENTVFYDGNVFGGGFGEAATIGGNVTLNMSNNNNQTLILNSVYGGGEAGSVLGTTTSEIVGKSNENPVIVNGSIYGGGRGYLVDAEGNTIDSTEQLGTVSGNASVSVKYAKVGFGNYTQVESPDGEMLDTPVTGGAVFGGGENGLCEKNTKVVVDNCNIQSRYIYNMVDGEISETFLNVGGSVGVAGGGFYSDVLGNTDVLVDNSKIGGQFYVGTLDNKTGVINYNMTPMGDVFGAGCYGEVKGRVNLVVNEEKSGDNGTIITGDVYGGGYLGLVGENNTVQPTCYAEFDGGLARNVFGGGNYAAVKGDTFVKIGGCTHTDSHHYATIQNSVYGGGSLAAVDGNTKVFFTEGYVGYDSKEDAEANKISSIMYKNDSGEYFGGNVFGAGWGLEAEVTGDSEVFDDNSEKVFIVAGSVFGGGETGAVKGNSQVLINDGKVVNSKISVVQKSVYGAGRGYGYDYAGNPIDVGETENVAMVHHNTKVVLNGITVNESVYGGGEIGDVAGDKATALNKFDAVDENTGNVSQVGIPGTFVKIEKSDIHKDVYGGGLDGYVGAQAIVDISDGVIDGSVYGGGCNGDVRNVSYVTVDGGLVKKNIYGGGYNGSIITPTTADSMVADFPADNEGYYYCSTYVSVTGGVIEGSIFGASYNGNTNYSAGIEIYDTKVYKNVYAGAYNGKVGVNGTEDKYTSTAGIYIAGGTFGTESDSESGNIFGGGYGSSSNVPNSLVDIENSKTSNLSSATVKVYGSIFGGSQTGTVGSGTVDNSTGYPKSITYSGKAKVVVRQGKINGSIYGAGSGQVDDETFFPSYGAVFGSTDVQVYGGTIQGDVFGGGLRGRVFATTNPDKESKTTNACRVEVNANKGDSETVRITGSIFGGCSRGSDASESADTYTVFGDTYVYVQGENQKNIARDMAKVSPKMTSRKANTELDSSGADVGPITKYISAESIYGDGSLALVDGYREVFVRDIVGSSDDAIFSTIEGMHASDTVANCFQLDSIQRANNVTLENSELVLKGAYDKVAENDDKVYSINRVEQWDMTKASAIYLKCESKYLGGLSSDVDINGSYLQPDDTTNTRDSVIYYEGTGDNYFNNGIHKYQYVDGGFVGTDGVTYTAKDYNSIVLAAGIKLEVLKTGDGSVESDWGLVKGVFTLVTSMTAENGVGGGFVYGSTDSTGTFAALSTSTGRYGTTDYTKDHNYENYMNVTDKDKPDGTTYKRETPGYNGMASTKTLDTSEPDSVYHLWYVNGSQYNYEFILYGTIGETDRTSTYSFEMPVPDSDLKVNSVSAESDLVKGLINNGLVKMYVPSYGVNKTVNEKLINSTLCNVKSGETGVSFDMKLNDEWAKEINGDTLNMTMETETSTKDHITYYITVHFVINYDYPVNYSYENYGTQYDGVALSSIVNMTNTSSYTFDLTSQYNTGSYNRNVYIVDDKNEIITDLAPYKGLKLTMIDKTNYSDINGGKAGMYYYIVKGDETDGKINLGEFMKMGTTDKDVDTTKISFSGVINERLILVIDFEEISGIDVENYAVVVGHENTENGNEIFDNKFVRYQKNGYGAFETTGYWEYIDDNYASQYGERYTGIVYSSTDKATRAIITDTSSDGDIGYGAAGHKVQYHANDPHWYNASGTIYNGTVYDEAKNEITTPTDEQIGYTNTGKVLCYTVNRIVDKIITITPGRSLFTIQRDKTGVETFTMSAKNLAADKLNNITLKMNEDNRCVDTRTNTYYGEREYSVKFEILNKENKDLSSEEMQSAVYVLYNNKSYYSDYSGKAIIDVPMTFKNGTANLEMYIPKDLKAGDYYVRATLCSSVDNEYGDELVGAECFGEDISYTYRQGEEGNYTDKFRNNLYDKASFSVFDKNVTTYLDAKRNDGSPLVITTGDSEDNKLSYTVDAYGSETSVRNVDVKVLKKSTIGSFDYEELSTDEIKQLFGSTYKNIITTTNYTSQYNLNVQNTAPEGTYRLQFMYDKEVDDSDRVYYNRIDTENFIVLNEGKVNIYLKDKGKATDADIYKTYTVDAPGVVVEQPDESVLGLRTGYVLKGWYYYDDNDVPHEFRFDQVVTESCDVYPIIETTYITGNCFQFYTEFSYSEPWEMEYSALFMPEDKKYVSMDSSRITDQKIYILTKDGNDTVVPDISDMLNDAECNSIEDISVLEEFHNDNYKWANFKYNKTINTVDMDKHIYVMFSLEYDGMRYISNVKDRSLADSLDMLVNQLGEMIEIYDDYDLDPIEFVQKQKVCREMLNLHRATKNYNSGLSTDISSYAKAAANSIKSMPGADSETYAFKHAVALRASQPWGVELSATLPEDISLSSAEDYGVVLMRDGADGTLDYTDEEMPSMEDILRNSKSVIYSKSKGNISLSADENTMTAYYFGATASDINATYSTYQLNNNVYTLFYVKSGGKYYVDKVMCRNLQQIVESLRKSPMMNNYPKEKSVIEAIGDLWQAIREYNDIEGIIEEEENF